MVNCRFYINNECSRCDVYPEYSTFCEGCAKDGSCQTCLNKMGCPVNANHGEPKYSCGEAIYFFNSVKDHSDMWSKISGIKPKKLVKAFDKMVKYIDDNGRVNRNVSK